MSVIAGSNILGAFQGGRYCFRERPNVKKNNEGKTPRHGHSSIPRTLCLVCIFRRQGEHGGLKGAKTVDSWHWEILSPSCQAIAGPNPEYAD